MENIETFVRCALMYKYTTRVAIKLYVCARLLEYVPTYEEVNDATSPQRVSMSTSNIIIVFIFKLATPKV